MRRETLTKQEWVALEKFRAALTVACGRRAWLTDWDMFVESHGVQPSRLDTDDDLYNLVKKGVDPDLFYTKALLLWG